MSYSEFKMEDLKNRLHLKVVQEQTLFPDIVETPLTEAFLQYFNRYRSLALAIDTEKARSEYIIAPLLAEIKVLHKDRLSLFSGIEFNVDKSDGLEGRCDFILARSNDQFFLTAPVVVMVEAKNDNIKSGIPQCGAEMVAAQRFNIAHQTPIEAIYGCVSTGTNWKFLKLVGQDFYIDTEEYYIDNPARIMAILTQMSL